MSNPILDRCTSSLAESLPVRECSTLCSLSWTRGGGAKHAPGIQTEILNRCPEHSVIQSPHSTNIPSAPLISWRSSSSSSLPLSPAFFFFFSFSLTTTIFGGGLSRCTRRSRLGMFCRLESPIRYSPFFPLLCALPGRDGGFIGECLVGPFSMVGLVGVVRFIGSGAGGNGAVCSFVGDAIA